MIRYYSATASRGALTRARMSPSLNFLTVAAPMDSESCRNGLPIRKRVLFPLLIVVILADDLGYGDVGFNGCLDIPTPNIDSVAANGALCTNGYATHPFCSPSRAAIITGRYQQRFGYENQPMIDASNPRLGLPLTELTLPQLLKPAGYVCGAIGKWHLGVALNLFPTERGFDEF